MSKNITLNQQEKIFRISAWLAKLQAIQTETYLEKNWDILPKLNGVLIFLSSELIRIIRYKDTLDEKGWEFQLFDEILNKETILAHRQSVEASVKYNLMKLKEELSVD